MNIETIINEGNVPKKRIVEYRTPHVGTVNTPLQIGQIIGEGDLLYSITRLGICGEEKAKESGTVLLVNPALNGLFGGYDTPIVKVEHTLTDEERNVIIEERAYDFVHAEFNADYYLTPNEKAPPLVKVGDIVEDGNFIAVALVMKKTREIIYHGPAAEIKKIYFERGETKNKGDKLFGLVKVG